MGRVGAALASAVALWSCSGCGDDGFVTDASASSGTNMPTAGQTGHSTEASTSTAPGTGDTSSSVSDTTQTNPTTASSGSSGSGTTGEPIDCTDVPDPAPAWLQPYQSDIVARLSGDQPLWDDEATVLPERSTPEHRAQTAMFLTEQLEALGLQPQTHDYAASATNVYAMLPATTDRDAPYLVVGAHFDTVPDSPGANDNATGVALVLALARYSSELPCRNRNLVFVLFDEEEIGLVGSWHFAQLLSEQAFDIEAAHTIDQMGWDSDGDRAIEVERADEGLLEFYQAAAAQLADPPILTPTQTGFTDHVSFRDWGFAAVGLTEEFVSGDTTRHYHLQTDTFDTVDFGYLASTTALANLAFATALSQ